MDALSKTGFDRRGAEQLQTKLINSEAIFCDFYDNKKAEQMFHQFKMESMNTENELRSQLMQVQIHMQNIQAKIDETHAVRKMAEKNWQTINTKGMQEASTFCSNVMTFKNSQYVNCRGEQKK